MLKRNTKYLPLAGIAFSALISLLPACHSSGLLWEDRFDRTNTLDSTVWSKIPRNNAPWGRHMSDFDSCYRVSDGYLTLRGIINHSVPGDTMPYLTGGVYTKGKRGFANGRLEIRAKFVNAQGAWPAIWLLPMQGSWPDGGEIDIMEHLNFDTIAYQTVHSRYTYVMKQGKNPPQGATGPINKDDFNIYAVEMRSDELRFYINGKHTFSYPRLPDKEWQFPFVNKEFYLLIDMQLGGDWVGEINPDDLPAEMIIDWVRFYELPSK